MVDLIKQSSNGHTFVQTNCLNLVRKQNHQNWYKSYTGHFVAKIASDIGDYIAKGANYEFCSLNTWLVLTLWLIYDRDFNVPREVVRSIITLPVVSKRNFTGFPREFCRTFCWLPHNTYNLFSSVQHCNCAIIMNAAVHPCDSYFSGTCTIANSFQKIIR